VLLDYTSLLLATGFSGICLSMMMVLTWLSARAQSFMLTWAAGILMLVAHVFCYGVYVQDPSPTLFPVLISLLVIGLSIILGAAYQFCHGTSPVRPAVIASVISVVASILPLAWGLDGAALIVENIAAGILLALAGVVYLRNRQQARTPMTALFVLYALMGTSFALCGVVLLVEGAWVIGRAPDNWAERLNIIAAVSGMSGAGAISLGLHHSRMARRHEIDSLTDPLTGLKNRRALFTLWGERSLGPFCAVALFDIDHFKQVNDSHGHAAGDRVLAEFGHMLARAARKNDLSVRLGGEEFALLMPRIEPGDAIAIAERIRVDLSSMRFPLAEGAFSCTVSVGLGWGTREGASLEKVLADADHALYSAKRDGRDRVGTEGFWRQAV
jgi:diguanylate cyclase (GGDEF)-like protein